MKIVWLSCLLAAVPALSGCFLFSTGEGSRVKSVPDEFRRPRLVVPPVMDVHPYGDPAAVKVGQWAAYRDGDRTITLAVVLKVEEGAWFEVIDEGEPRQASARLVSAGGEVVRALYCEISEEGRSAVEPQEIRQWVAPPAADRTKTGEETGVERVTVAGKDLEAKRVRVRYEDLEGRLTTEVSLWHPDVPPIYAGSDDGGLVRREQGGVVVELVDFGTDAKPVVQREEKDRP